MRSYNFVVDITPDIEDVQYRIRAIDFDQQSYEGRKNLYLPQFFKENAELVDLAMKHLNKDSIEQYQTEERTLMAFRVASYRHRTLELLNIMSKDNISTKEKTDQLKMELSEYTGAAVYKKLTSMGHIVKWHLKEMLRKNLVLVQQNLGRFED